MNEPKKTKWTIINEIEQLIDHRYLKRDNIVKGHVDTFFDKIGRGVLQYALLEITTLFNSNAIGEVFIFSHFNEEEEHRMREDYKAIIKRVKEKYAYNISAYKKWYSKKTWLLIGENEGNELIDDDLHFSWSEPTDQKEQRERHKYAHLDDDLIHEDIESYLNYYHQELVKHGFFEKYRHYAVIVKPLHLKYYSEVIPVGNLYLHFGTKEFIDEALYTKFLNEFTSIYLNAKGGHIVRELEAKLAAQLATRPEYQPNFDTDDKVRGDNIKAIISRINETYADPEREAVLRNRIENLNADLRKFMSYDRVKDLDTFERTIDRKNFSDFPAVSNLMSAVSGISISNILIGHRDLDDYVLFRHFTMALLLAYDFTPKQVHNFLRKKGFSERDLPTSSASFEFFTNKLYIFMSKTWLEANIKLRDSQFDDDVFLQCSKSEQAFISAMKLNHQ